MAYWWHETPPYVEDGRETDLEPHAPASRDVGASDSSLSVARALAGRGGGSRARENEPGASYGR